jgi:GT2 family glycosyltransferase
MTGQVRAIADVTVVVVTYNRAALLRRAVESLFRQDTGGRLAFRILIVDNGSSDDTPAVAAELARASPVPLRAVREERHGVAPARNRGVAECPTPWIAFFDDDQVAERRWLAELCAVAEARGVPCVGGRIALELPEEEKARLPPLCRSLLGETQAAAEPRPYPRKALPGTGNVLLARLLFDELGGFDEALAAGCEDADFFRRLRRAGIEPWYAPRSLASHHVPPHRLERDYFVWVSLRQGASYAYLDNKECGRPLTAAACAARVGKALVLTMPRLATRTLARDGAAALADECLLWRTVGYARETLFLLAPRVFGQRRFFSSLDFRVERR